MLSQKMTKFELVSNGFIYFSKKLLERNLSSRHSLARAGGQETREKEGLNHSKYHRLAMSAFPPEISWDWGWAEYTALSVIPLTYVLYRYLYASLIEWRQNGIPYVPVRPLVGSIADAALVRKSIGEVYADIYRDNQRKRYVGFYRFMQPAILLRDPLLIKKVIVTDFEYFPSNEVKGDTQVDPMFGRHLFALSGEPWSRMRGSFGEAFTKDSIREISALFPEVNDILKSYLDIKSRKGGGKWEVDLMELCTNYTTTTMSTCALGELVDSINNPDTELKHMVRLLTEPTPKRVMSQLIFLQVPWLAKLLKIPFVPKEVREYFRRTVAHEVERRRVGGCQRNDYMQLLIKLWDAGRLSLTPRWEKNMGDAHKIAAKRHSKAAECKKETAKDQKQGAKGQGDETAQVMASEIDQDEMDDITAAALAFVSDGTVTTATLLSFTIFELAHHDEIQKRVRMEVEEVLKRHKGVLTYEALQEMTYLDMVMHETMRFYPPAPFMVRSCSKPYRLPNPYRNSDYGGLVLKEGFPVVVPMYGIHMDNAFYPNAKEFDPNRFSKEEINARETFTYYPYGGGPRICVGFRLGLLMAKSAIATLIPHFELSPHEKTQRPITFDPRYFITVSKGGLWVQVRSMPTISSTQR
ncbi:cytochrome P450 9e2-like isoform X2 [Ischnura elegans]|uniref:cytochrome P450 9e2-like isoform X2 n=1 Tax=Ischnura elegans TaxID=197161 RepID=UPI001ED8B9C7|nr:cytochrome P450 9e2-like isoform X2 [Ischnura elegans]